MNENNLEVAKDDQLTTIVETIPNEIKQDIPLTITQNEIKQDTILSTNLGKWNVSKKSFTENFSMLMLASRRSGKSYLLKHLFDNYMKFNKVVIFTRNKSNYDDWKTKMIYDKFNEGTLQILNNYNKKNNERILIIFDDFMGKDTKSSEEISKLFSEGRHNGLSVVFLVQELKGAATTWRNNSDYVIILRNNSQDERLKIIDKMLRGSVFYEGKSEIKFYSGLIKKYTENYKCLIIDNLQTSSDINDKLSWYRA